MKFIKVLLMVGILFTVMGCKTTEVKETPTESLVTFTEADVSDATGYCILTASAKSDGKFLMVNKLFSEKIPCDTNDDCYSFLLEQDDYRSLPPEFEPYLNCEDRDDTISPNKINPNKIKLK